MKVSEDTVLGFYGKYFKAQGASLSQHLARMLTNPMDAFNYLTAMKKMGVTVGVGLITVKYFMGNFIGGALQAWYHGGLNSQLVGMAAGGAAGVAAVGGASMAAVPAMVAGATVGGLALPGVIGTRLNEQGWQSIGNKIPEVMMLLYSGEEGKITKLANKFPSMFSDRPFVTKFGEIVSSHDIAREMKLHGAGTSFLKAETSALFAENLRDFDKGLFREFWDQGIMAKGLKELFVDLAEAMDNYYRVAMYIDLRKKGHSPRAAAKEVATAMFDYADLSDFEKGFLRIAFLFYAFMRKNTNMLASVALRNPHRLAGFMRLRRDLQRDQYEVAQPELRTSPWSISKPPIPFLWQPIGRAVPTVLTDIYEGFAILSPPVNDYDGFNLLLGLKALVRPSETMSRAEGVQSLASGLNPLLSFPVVALNERMIFGNRPLESVRIEPHIIQIDRTLGGFMFNLDDTNERGWIKLKLHTPKHNEKTVSRFKVARDAMKGDHPGLGYGYYTPASPDDGMNWYILNEIILPAYSAGMPLGYILGPFHSRGATQISAIDRADLLKGFAEWQKCSGSFTALCSILAGEDVSKMSKEDYQKIFESRGIGNKISSGMLFDLLIKPPGVPRESLMAELLGLGLQPVIKQSKIPQLKYQDFYFKFKYDLK